MANFGFVTGNLAAAPRILTNKDGSHKVFMSIYSANDFPNCNGKYESEVVSVEAFVAKNRSARRASSAISDNSGSRSCVSVISKGAFCIG